VKSAQPRRLPDSLRAETRRKILFSLEEKEIRRAQNEKSKEYFPAGHASGASDGGVSQFSRSKKVRAKCIITAPVETFSGLGKGFWRKSKRDFGFRKIAPYS